MDKYEEYKEMADKLGHFIPREANVYKRPSFLNIPYATIHSMIVIHYYEQEFVIYEQYGTQYMKTLPARDVG